MLALAVETAGVAAAYGVAGEEVATKVSSVGVEAAEAEACEENRAREEGKDEAEAVGTDALVVVTVDESDGAEEAANANEIGFAVTVPENMLLTEAADDDALLNPNEDWRPGDEGVPKEKLEDDSDDEDEEVKVGVDRGAAADDAELAGLLEKAGMLPNESAGVEEEDDDDENDEEKGDTELKDEGEEMEGVVADAAEELPKGEGEKDVEAKEDEDAKYGEVENEGAVVVAKEVPENGDEEEEEEKGEEETGDDMVVDELNKGRGVVDAAAAEEVVAPKSAEPEKEGATVAAEDEVAVPKRSEELKLGSVEAEVEVPPKSEPVAEDADWENPKVKGVDEDDEAGVAMPRPGFGADAKGFGVEEDEEEEPKRERGFAAEDD